MNGSHCLVPRVLAGAIPDRLSRAAHAGLYWTRWLPMWQGPDEGAGPVHDDRHSAARTALLDAFVGDFNARGSGSDSPARSWLRVHRERIERSVKAMARVHGWSCALIEAEVAWRLVSGGGSDHPMETSLALDPIIGVPFLAGSAVKGLCRRAAQALDLPAAERERLLGPDTEAAERRPARGQARFFDAYPRGWPTLERDILNSHHPGYYQSEKKGRDMPVETEDPVPVSFLCVGAGSRFVFPLVAETEADLERTAGLLRDGLALLGIGGKTAVGYGALNTFVAR